MINFIFSFGRFCKQKKKRISNELETKNKRKKRNTYCKLNKNKNNFRYENVAKSRAIPVKKRKVNNKSKKK